MKRNLLILPVLLGLCGHAHAQNPGELTPERLTGDWSASETGALPCTLSLRIEGGPLGYKAYPFGCTGADLQKAATWRLRNTSIIITDVDGGRLALLKIAKPNRFEGKSVSGNQIVILR